MKCQGCGHEYPSTFPRCSRCGELTPRRTLRSSPSRLIEFPRKTRVEVEKESTENLLPSWRKELNEKVRAVRARKGTVSTETPRVEVPSSRQEISEEKVQVDTRGRRVESPARTFRSSPALAKTAPAISPSDVPRTSNAIVEAALSRVRRATENASRASLSRIEPVRSGHQNQTPSMSVDKEATARALEVTVDLSPKPVIAAPPLASVKTPQPQSRARDLATIPDLSPDQSHDADPPALPVVSRTVAQEQPATVEFERTAEPEPAAPPVVMDRYASRLDSVEDQVCVRVLDEDEPLDYLQAEIRKIDRARAEEFAHNESPSLGVHAIIAVIDLLTITVSSIPFLLVIRIMDGSLGDGRTEIAAGLIVALVSFFYLAVTQCLSGKTFGMMLTNTRVVDAYTLEAPSGQRFLLRTIGYFVAIAPATLGLIWIAFNRYRRGWHDVISGTRVVRDF